MPKLVSLPHFHGQIRSHSDWFHHFAVTTSRSKCCYENVYDNSFLTAISLSRPWNSLPVECLFSLTCDLNSFKLTDTFFLRAFLKQLCYILLSFSSLLFFVTSCLVWVFNLLLEVKPNFLKKYFIKNYFTFYYFFNYLVGK